jgi:hypothetical protein
MKATKILYMALLLTFFYTPDSFSHNGWFHQGRCDWKSENNRQRISYTQNKPEVILGEVISRELVASMRRSSKGVHLVISTEEGTVRVILGPEKYLSTQPVSIELGDFVEIAGTLITYQEEAALLAFQVSVDDETLYLRDENGISLWSRRGRR